MDLIRLGDFDFSREYIRAVVKEITRYVQDPPERHSHGLCFWLSEQEAAITAMGEFSAGSYPLIGYVLRAYYATFPDLQPTGSFRGLEYADLESGPTPKRIEFARFVAGYLTAVLR